MLISNIIELAVAYLLAIMLPGPSLSLIIKNGVLYARKACFKTSFGIITGIALQFSLALIFTSLIKDNFIFFKIIKVLCSLYLVSMGSFLILKQLYFKNFKNNFDKKTKYSNFFIEALFVELLNPLAFTFFISIVTTIINAQEMWINKVIYCFEIITIGVIWFFPIAYIVSSQKVIPNNRIFKKTIEIVAGAAFILFGSKILLF